MAPAVACGSGSTACSVGVVPSASGASSSSSSSSSASPSWLRVSQQPGTGQFCSAHHHFHCHFRRGRRACSYLNVRAVSAPEECNEEECAPQKEVGKVSMEWKAEENTKVVGTYPPLSKKKWTGYVEKDTAGQTNIYSIEPTVYVSENVISSNTVGDSSKGSENTVLVSAGLALGLLLAAGLVLQRVSTSPVAPTTPDSVYSGPTLSFYVQKFKPTPVIEAAAPAPTPAAEPEAPSLPLVEDFEF